MKPIKLTDAQMDDCLRLKSDRDESHMPIALTERNGFVVSHGLKIVRGGMGEFLICKGDNCIGVCRSYGAAQAFANGYFQGANSAAGRYVDDSIDECGDTGWCDFHARGNDRSAPCSGGGGRAAG